MWKTWKSQKKSNQTVTFSIRLSPRLTLTLTAVLRGWGERKDEKSRLSGGWNRRWVSRSDDIRLVMCVWSTSGTCTSWSLAICTSGEKSKRKE